MKKITIELNESTVKRLEELANYIDLENKLFYKIEETTTIEELIKGSIIRQLWEMEVLLGDKKLNKDIEKVGVLKNRFKELMKQHEVKQIELAKLTDIDTSTLNLILNNKQTLSLENFLKLWTAFNHPPIRTVLYRE
ncbi:helix-turn-helix transcriptional regulator [Alkalihalophilus pseudofirmus]|uniref:helix-turn-helix domain-containing protein n=1 Tax=Alkalihalophilus pseudofirmus TaxID=79885 RepID=UPI00259BB188|nr:helix-turn-helix transcriptional regulator [Alkalihalophilus pseudofirmus]WEG18527.1 helix-turn-helix transcriptional regulator [Alkalihalophilus pseudofirmus]